MRNMERSDRSRVRAVAMLLCVILAACGRTDPAIQIAVDAQLAASTATATLSLDISVSRGVVRLAGEVASRDQQRRAVELARSVDGVDAVIDEMYPGDGTIVTAVTQALAADPLLGKVPIEVDARGGHVRLMSEQTDKEQRARAMALARKVDGVKDVEDRMR
jgi:osmotically-inducible protein OsmY